MPRVALALEYPLMQQGGTVVLVRELLRGLSKDFELILVSGEQSRTELPEELSRCITEHLSWDEQAPDPSGAARKLAAALAAHNPALVHFHLGGAYCWRTNRFWQSPIYHLSRSGVACIATTHLVDRVLASGCSPSRPDWIKAAILARAWPSRIMATRRLRTEICVSKHDQARLRKQFPPLRAKIGQIYHSLLRLDEPPPQLDAREKAILCVGTIGGRKAQHILAHAFGRIAHRHPDWRLDFIGRTDVPTDLERVKERVAAHQAGAQVNLLGRLPDEEVLRHMKSASIVAMPSLQEGLGLSLQEAIFHGCVAVGTRVGGIPELIDHEVNGLLVAPGNVDELSAALERVITDNALRSRMAAQARPSIVCKGMSADAMIEAYVKLYRSIMEGGPA